MLLYGCITMHGQQKVKNTELLLPILKACCQWTLIIARYAFVLDAFSLCVFLEVSVSTTNNRPLVPALVNISRNAPHTTARAGDVY